MCNKDCELRCPGENCCTGEDGLERPTLVATGDRGDNMAAEGFLVGGVVTTTAPEFEPAPSGPVAGAVAEGIVLWDPEAVDARWTETVRLPLLPLPPVLAVLRWREARDSVRPPWPNRLGPPARRRALRRAPAPLPVA